MKKKHRREQPNRKIRKTKGKKNGKIENIVFSQEADENKTIQCRPFEGKIHYNEEEEEDDDLRRGEKNTHAYTHADKHGTHHTFNRKYRDWTRKKKSPLKQATRNISDETNVGMRVQ